MKPQLLLLTLLLTLLFKPLYAQNQDSVPQILSSPKGHSFWYVHTPNSPITALHAIYPFSYRSLQDHTPAVHKLIANLSEELLTTRTSSFDRNSTNQILNNFSAYIGIDISSLFVLVEMHFVTSTQHNLKNLFRATLNENFVDSYDFNRFKKSQKIDLSEQLKNPSDRVQRTVINALFHENSPWGKQSLPQPHMFPSISKNHITNFNKKWQTSPVKFVALTSMSKEETASFIDFIVPKKSSSPPPPPPPAVPSPNAWGKHIHLQDDDLEQTKITFALPGISRTHPDFPSILLLSRILEEHYLTPSIRKERGLAYGVQAYPVSYSHNTGFVFIQSATEQQQTPEVISLIKDAIQSLVSKPINKKTINAARSAAINSLTLDLTDNPSIAHSLTQPLFENKPADTLSYYTQEIQAVTPEKLHSLAKSLWETKPLIVTIGPSDPF
jgi:predicted Zn-dependent peptidase